MELKAFRRVHRFALLASGFALGLAIACFWHGLYFATACWCFTFSSSLWTAFKHSQWGCDHEDSVVIGSCGDKTVIARIPVMNFPTPGALMLMEISMETRKLRCQRCGNVRLLRLPTRRGGHRTIVPRTADRFRRRTRTGGG